MHRQICIECDSYIYASTMLPYIYIVFPKQFTVGVYLRKESWPHSLAAPLNSVAGLCGLALWPGSVSGSCPPLVLVLATPLNSVAWLCGRALWPVSVSGSCPPLVLVLATPVNSVAWLCGRALWPGSVARLCVRVLPSSCSPNSLLLGFYLRKKTGHTDWPELCGLLVPTNRFETVLGSMLVYF